MLTRDNCGGTKKQILVVENEGLIADDLQKRLERLGYCVPAIAYSAQQAFELARATPFDLVLMDISLKGKIDGIEAAEVLQEELETPVVFVTAHAHKETFGRALATEPFGYVLKPIAIDSLHKTIEIALHRHEMERRLRESENWLRTTLSNIGEGIFATDPSGEIVFMNPAAEQLTGWTKTEAYARMLTDVLVLLEENTQIRAAHPVGFPNEKRKYSLLSKGGANIPVEVVCFDNQSPGQALGAIFIVRELNSNTAGGIDAGKRQQSAGARTRLQ
jgi:PAS domain S-box-containing protein